MFEHPDRPPLVRHHRRSQFSEEPSQHFEVGDSSSRQLENKERSRYESVFDHDFSHVRIHDDDGARRVARDLGAEAFTVGSHVFLGSPVTALDSPRNQALMAHELAHVVQQDSAAGLSWAPHGAVSDRAEVEAEAAAKAVSSGTNLTELPLTKSLGLQKATGVEVAGLMISGVSVLRDQYGSPPGSLFWESDQIAYPKELERVQEGSRSVEKVVAEFYSQGRILDNRTQFVLHGEFSDSTADAAMDNRVMSNVYIVLGKTTTYYGSDLSFKARGLQTPYGTAEDPKVRFSCTGRFDPVGGGDIGYTAILEIDQHANVECIKFTPNHGSAYVVVLPGNGFRVELRDSMSLFDSSYRTADSDEQIEIDEWKDELERFAGGPQKSVTDQDPIKDEF